MRRVLLFALPALAVSCSIFAGARSPEEEGERFHQLYSAGDYATLYRTISELQRSGMDDAVFVELMSDARNHLGPVRSARLRSVRRHSWNGDRYVGLRYDTQFERGTAQEQITYRVGDGGRLQLEGYQVRSPDWPGVLWGTPADMLEEVEARGNRH